MLNHMFFSMVLMLFALPFAAQTHAQDLIVSGQNEESVISGRIADIGFDTMTLSIGEGENVEVDIDNLDLDEGRFDEFFSEGMYVDVVGRFDDDEFDADRIVRTAREGGVTYFPEVE